MPSVKRNVTRTIDLAPAMLRLGLGANPQGRRPTCSVFATVNAMEYAVAARLGKGVRLSQEYLNWAKNQEASKNQDGDFFHIIWAGYEARGICDVGLLPYREVYEPNLHVSDECRANALFYRALNLKMRFIKGWDADRGLADAEFRAILNRIGNGWPVMCGMRWPKEPRFENGAMAWAPPGGVFDGHSVLLVGYALDAAVEGGGCFLASDSGTNRNDFKISFRFVKDYANDACWVQ